MRLHADLILEEIVPHSHMLNLNTGIASHHEISNILTVANDEIYVSNCVVLCVFGSTQKKKKKKNIKRKKRKIALQKHESKF